VLTIDWNDGMLEKWNDGMAPFGQINACGGGWVVGRKRMVGWGYTIIRHL
jgi:hypothetical protein